MWKSENKSRKEFQYNVSEISGNIGFNIAHFKEIFKDNENLKTRTF